MYKRSRSEGFGPEVKRRIMLGSFVLSSGYYDAYYLKALKTKALIKQAFDRAFKHFDVILGPTAPSTAPKLGQSLCDPLKMYLGDIYTISVNLAGLPAMSVPCGKDSQGLPIGVQLIGDCFQEKNIIRAGYAYECSRSYEQPELAVRGAERDQTMYGETGTPKGSMAMENKWTEESEGAGGMGEAAYAAAKRGAGIRITASPDGTGTGGAA